MIKVSFNSKQQHMKSSLLLLLTFLLTVSIGYSQTNIQFNIHHKLGGPEFEFDNASTNNMDHDFKVTRLEYYISEISIVHDGGMITPINDTWVLVNASEYTQVELGNHDITEIEKIRFSIGVNESVNHADPSSYDSSHPLSPKSPSMHWGWSSGYRFIAIEGFGGANYDQLFQLHGLGDGNYFQNEVNVDVTASNGSADIHIDAEYGLVLRNISLNSGVIVHGTNLQAKQSLENMRDFVFSPTTEIISATDIADVNSFSVYPNPVFNNNTTIVLDSKDNLDYDVSVTNILGQEVSLFEDVKASVNLNIKGNGLFFVNLIRDGRIILTEKLMVK